MRLQRQLNIDNTYRVLNLNFFKLIKDKITLVDPKNKDEILNELKNNNGKDKTYLLTPEISTDLLLNHRVFQCDGKIIYYTTSAIPTSIFLDIGTNRNSIYVYKLQDFDKKILQNISKASIIGTTAVYVPNIKKGLNTTDLIFKLNDVRFIADRVYLDFNKHVSIAEKEKIFDDLHEVLARWTIQLFLSWNTQGEYKKLKKDIIKKYK